jgi:hypothetical protein
MRYIPLEELLRKMFSEPAGAKFGLQLVRANIKLARLPPGLRLRYIRDNGPSKWSPIKNWLSKKLGNKCWYTEAELVGAPLSIDHFRPISNYWWLAFEAKNYRLACAYANSPQHNELYGRSGGKGHAFPLLGSGRRSTWRNNRRIEKPLILDPCLSEDCNLVAFQADGRPVINPAHAGDVGAFCRVEENKVLLNLDHPAFNSQREQLYHAIADDVKTYEELPANALGQAIIVNRLEKRLSAGAPFSSAARFYLRLHRHLDWIEALLART